MMSPALAVFWQLKVSSLPTAFPRLPLDSFGPGETFGGCRTERNLKCPKMTCTSLTAATRITASDIETYPPSPLLLSPKASPGLKRS